MLLGDTCLLLYMILVIFIFKRSRISSAANPEYRCGVSYEEEINQRIYKFPTSHIKVKNRKSSYFEVITSLQFEACNEALQRIVPRIDLTRIGTIIDENLFRQVAEESRGHKITEQEAMSRVGIASRSTFYRRLKEFVQMAD